MLFKVQKSSGIRTHLCVVFLLNLDTFVNLRIFSKIRITNRGNLELAKPKILVIFFFVKS